MVGPEKEDTLLALSLYASVLGNQGKYEAAEEADRRALEGYEKVLGKGHPDTLISLWCLTDLMERVGQKHDALSLHECAVIGLRTSLGVRHPHALQSQCSSERLQR